MKTEGQGCLTKILEPRMAMPTLPAFRYDAVARKPRKDYGRPHFGVALPGNTIYAGNILGRGSGTTMLSQRWAKAAVVYFVIGVGFGLYMSLSQMHIYRSLHAHVNLLGWASMALIAVYYRMYPALEQHRLAPVTFWMYQIFFPMMMAGLFLARMQLSAIAVPFVGFGGLFTAVAVMLFAVNVFGSLRTEPRGRGTVTPTETGGVGVSRSP